VAKTARSSAPGRTKAVAKPLARQATFDEIDFSVTRLTARDRANIASISTRLRVRSGTTIYERGDRAAAIYSIAAGAALSFRPLRSDTRRVMGFLFAEDVFGLSRAGHYVNTVKALTPLTLFRIPAGALKTMMLRNPELQLHFLCKVTQALRESQRHHILINAESPVSRVSRFLTMLDQAQPRSDEEVVHLPMTRKDIGDYLNLTASGVGAALSELARRGAIAPEDPHHVRLLDRRQLAVASDDH
jgi:CRP/FNR family transcriptional regulator